MAIAAMLVGHLALSLGAWLRTDNWDWFGDVIRPVILVVLPWLAIRGQAWAAWSLVAWLAIASISSVTWMFAMAAAGYPWDALLAAGSILLYAWVASELVMAERSRTSSRLVDRGAS